MKSLLIVAHGSRIEPANHEIRQLALEMEKRSDHSFRSVRHAFLEFAGPSVEDRIDDLVRSGFTEIVIFPLFLAAGKHVKVDLPGMIRDAGKHHPKVSFRLSSHLGRTRGLKQLILDEAHRCFGDANERLPE